MTPAKSQVTVLIKHNPVQAAKQHAHIDQIIKAYRASKVAAKGGAA